MAEFLSFSNPIPVFSISSQTQPSFFQSLSAINSLISVFFCFFSTQSYKLGAKILPAAKKFCGRNLRQNFHFLIRYSNMNILSS